MPLVYKRKTSKGNWTVATLKEAITCIQNKNLSIRNAAKTYNIPYSTLQERLKKNNLESFVLGRPSVFTVNQESEMVKHVINLSNLFYRLTPIQLRAATFEFAKNNNIQNNFNVNLNLAGVDWFYNFIRRNPTVTIRNPEAISMNRISAFNEIKVSRFFQNLEEVMEKYTFYPTRIFNMDETGITTVQDPGNIIAAKDQKCVGSVTSWERGKIIL